MVHLSQVAARAVASRQCYFIYGSVDLPFRLLLGFLIALYLVGHYWLSDAFAAIPVILCTGLIITAIFDKCNLRIGIAMLPWNRAQVNGN